MSRTRLLARDTEEFRKLHDLAIDAVGAPCPRRRSAVRTPPAAVAGSHGFIEHCLRGTNYATARSARHWTYIVHAKGAPRHNGHVRMGLQSASHD